MNIEGPYKEKWLREDLYDFGYKIPTNEMLRDFYLKNRISADERNKLVEIMKTFKGIIFNRHSPLLVKYPKAYVFTFGLLAVGTSVYPEEDFAKLEKFFAEKGISREDYFEEEAGAAMWNQQCREHETYDDYLKWCDEPEAFDEKLTPISEKEFNRRKNKEEIPYIKTKKVGDFLDRKGEDLDFIICNEMEEGSEYSSLRIQDLHSIFVEGMTEKGYNLRDEEDYLDGANYFITPEGKILRYKMIISPEKDGSCRISFPNLRSFHFYFESENLNIKIKKERINNWPFCQILRRGNIKDLESAIKNGEETGVFENPEFLKFEKI
jgi:hypothetical protein